jgi:hypothetical protein
MSKWLTWAPPEPQIIRDAPETVLTKLTGDDAVSEVGSGLGPPANTGDAGLDDAVAVFLAAFPGSRINTDPQPRGIPMEEWRRLRPKRIYDDYRRAKAV